MDARNNDFDFDFTPIGQAIKKARTSQGRPESSLPASLITTLDICRQSKMRGNIQVWSCSFSS